MATFSVSDTLRRVQHTGTGGAGPFAFAFQVDAQGDVRVLVDSTQKVLTTHYTVSVASGGNGTISFTSGNEPTTAQKITIMGKTPLARTSVYSTGGTLTAASLESDFDSELMRLQQLQEESKRSIQLPPETQRVLTGADGTTTGPLMFPYSNTVADNASKVVAYDTNGTSLTATQELGEFQGNWAASTAYVLRDIVKDTDNNNIYICVTAHTSSGSVPLSSNTDSAKWSLIVNAASATTSQTAAASSATAAASSATAAASSATGAASSATGAATSASSAEASTGAATFKYTFDNSTSIADPGSNGEWRWNNGTVGSVTSMAIRAATADTGNPDISPFIVTWDDSTSTVNGHVLFRKSGTPATFAIFALGAITDNTAWLQIALTHVASNGSWSNADTGYISFIGRNGDKGDTGSTGAKGDAPGLLMAWETTTTDTDQGAGKVWGNNGTVSSISVLYMDDVEAGGASINSFVDTWDDSTNTALRGTITITKNSAPENFHIFNQTGVVTSASTYSKCAVTFVQTSGTISDGDAVSVQFVRTGSKGADGSGSMSSFTMSDGSTTQAVSDGQTQTFAAGEALDVAVTATDTVTYSAEDASVTNKGVAELATTAETVTGTDTGRVVTPAGLHGALAGLTDATITASDTVIFADATDSQALKEDTVQGILDLAGGGGAWTLIGTSVASNSATLDQTGLDSTYDTYAIALSDMIPATDGVIAFMRVGDSGGVDSGASDYSWAGHRLSMSTSPGGGNNGDDADSEMQLSAANVGNATGEGLGALLFLHRPGDGTAYPVFSGHLTWLDNDGTRVTSSWGGVRLSVITLDRIQFLFSSGNTTSGRMTVWGIAHA